MASVVKVAFGRLILWPALRHGPARTIAGLAIVLGEGADRFSGWLRSRDRMSSAATGCGKHHLKIQIKKHEQLSVWQSAHAFVVSFDN